MEENCPTSRWYRFSLQTLLVVLTVMCIYLSWAMNWIHARQEALTRYLPVSTTVELMALESMDTYAVTGEHTPLLLLPFGEQGFDSLNTCKPISDADFQRLCDLFPESVVTTYKVNADGTWTTTRDSRYSDCCGPVEHDRSEPTP